MHTKTIITGILILFAFSAFAQNRTYLGIEFGPKFEVYDHVDNGDALYTKPFFFSPVFGVTVGQEINDIFTVETGFFVNDYGESYRIRGDIGWTSVSGIIAYQIPLRLKARLDLIKDRLSLVSTIGYTLAINNDYGYDAYGSSLSTSSLPGFNQRTETVDTSRYLKNTYGMLETGLALEYEFKNALSLYLSANYLRGFSRVTEIDVRYRIDNGPEQSGTVFSNGDYYSVVMGVRYPISNLWMKKREI